MQRWICVCLFSFILCTRLFGRFYSFDHVTIALIVCNSCEHWQADSIRKEWMVVECQTSLLNGEKECLADEEHLELKADKWTPASNNSSIASMFFAAFVGGCVLFWLLILPLSLLLLHLWCWWLRNGSWPKPSSVSTTFNHHKKKARHVQHIQRHILLV